MNLCVPKNQVQFRSLPKRGSVEGGNLNSHGAFSIGQSVNDSGRSPSYLVSDLVGHFLLKTANFQHPTLFSWSLPFKKGYYSPVEGILDSFQKKERVEAYIQQNWAIFSIIVIMFYPCGNGFKGQAIAIRDGCDFFAIALLIPSSWDKARSKLMVQLMVR